MRPCAKAVRWSTAAALALVTAGAFAGQITLYERQNFQGRSITTNDGLAVVARPGFDNGVVNPAPVVVGSPTVALTTQPVVVVPQPVAVIAPSPTGRAVLYEYLGFGGTSVTVDRGQANDLDWANFSSASKRAASIRVESGTWLFCSEMAFQGECRILGPGEYPRLSGSLAAGIASARQVSRPEYVVMNPYSR